MTRAALRRPPAEIRRLRAENDRLIDRLAEIGRLVAAHIAAADSITELRLAQNYQTGLAVGRRLEAAERDAQWHAVANPIAHGGLPHSELELRRWGPGGRVRFGEPRSGDFSGRCSNLSKPRDLPNGSRP